MSFIVFYRPTKLIILCISFYLFSVKRDKEQMTTQKKLELPNLPSRDHEPLPSTSTSKAPESDTLLTTPSSSDVERTPIVISGELEETYAPLPKKRQLSIVQSMERKYSYSDGGKDYQKLCKCLLYFICVDKRPFDIVKGRGFKKLMHQACPSFKISHVDTLKEEEDI